MRQSVQHTLLGDGSSDRILVPVLDWLLRAHLPETVTLDQAQVADLGRLPNPPPRTDLVSRIRVAAELYPCDVLFVHRDAEQRLGYAARRAEVEHAVRHAGLDVRCIPVVPVRMSEAWLLIDESALRRAADYPNGTASLEWPSPIRLEKIHAKQVLFDLLRAAANQAGRRRQRVSPERRRARLATLIDDFAPLRQFASFQDLERDVRDICATWALD